MQNMDQVNLRKTLNFSTTCQRSSISASNESRTYTPLLVAECHFLCFRGKQDKKPDNLQYKPIDKDQFIVEMVGYQGMFSSFMLLIK